MFNFKVNNDGKVIELHIHFTEEVYLTLIPKLLSSFDQLEVIRFPNNLIKNISLWIVHLQLLRILDVSNVESADPDVPDSIKSYIESLEHYNEFY